MTVRPPLEFRCGRAGCYGKVAEFRSGADGFELVLYQREAMLALEPGEDPVRAMIAGDNVKLRRFDPEVTPVPLPLDEMAEVASAEIWIIEPNCPKCGTTLDMRPLSPATLDVYRDPKKRAVILNPTAP